MTTDTEIRNQNTDGKPGAEIQNTFYISWLGLCSDDYLSNRSSLLFSHTCCLFLLMPKNNWEMNENAMSDDDIMDNFHLITAIS